MGLDANMVGSDYALAMQTLDAKTVPFVLPVEANHG
jgi:hypothetical protein